LSTPSAPQRISVAASFLLAVVLMLWLLAALSSWMTRKHLIHEARSEFTALRNDQPVWQWTLRKPRDLVAGRVFGAAQASGTAEGLNLTSRDGSAFELGLPVARPMDAAHWPLLRLRLRATTDGVLGFVYQANETSQACMAPDVVRIPRTSMELTIDLRSLQWHAADGGSCPPPGIISYMLRLRLQLPAQATWRLEDAALIAAQGAPLPSSIGTAAADIRLPDLPATGSPGWAGAPVARLPADASAETMLSLRDRIRQRWPAAMVLPFNQSLEASRDSAAPAWVDWGVLGIYLAGLAWLALRPTREPVRPWAETVAIAIGPLWLIAGLGWGAQVSTPGVIAFIAALVFGGVSEWRRRPVPWSWWGRSWSDWLRPLVPLLVAASLLVFDGHHLIRLTPAHVLTYVGWAMLQQWAMLAVVMDRLRQTPLPQPIVILITAGVFGLLHTPNGSLMQLCMLAELWWAWCFLRSPRLVPVAVAHAACALLVESGLTGHLLRSLEVSARFFL